MKSAGGACDGHCQWGISEVLAVVLLAFVLGWLEESKHQSMELADHLELLAEAVEAACNSSLGAPGTDVGEAP